MTLSLPGIEATDSWAGYKEKPSAGSVFLERAFTVVILHSSVHPLVAEVLLPKSTWFLPSSGQIMWIKTGHHAPFGVFQNESSYQLIRKPVAIESICRAHSAVHTNTYPN
ncbi:hypothetical protein Q6A49_05610 [Pseudomonas sp. 22-AL-CL-001]|jgi:hypothetical protein|uniref:hypothetical protein n=1 Tax=Pseudomonas alabamensis TaxID=3064349 RepID=UPI00271322CF|nr:hypothetical protein [Pseudomonas sp. 22-AL-CL-001]MDO7910006.1 hypothetical protein [Pseudomonas sp. 22-AL-CL-001]